MPAILSKKLANSRVKIIISLQGLPRAQGLKKLIWRIIHPLADAIIAPAKEIALEEEKIAGVRHENISVIYNPIINDEIFEHAKENVDHPWFQGNVPIIVSVGRLTRQKNFSSLIKAFAQVRKYINVKLLILGEGEDREKLEELVKRLEISQDVDLFGFVNNPYIEVGTNPTYDNEWITIEWRDNLPQGVGGIHSETTDSNNPGVIKRGYVAFRTFDPSTTGMRAIYLHELSQVMGARNDSNLIPSVFNSVPTQTNYVYFD